MKFVISFPDLPESMNAKGGGGYKGNHYAQHRVKKSLEGQLFVALIQAKVPKRLSRVKATAVLTVPTRHRRDEGNYRYMLEKALGDILQTMNYLPDDDPEHFTFPELIFEYKKNVRNTAITLEVG